MSAEREARLPRWAQDSLDRLRRRVSDLERALESLKPGPEIRVVTDAYAEHPKPIGTARTRVRFYLGEYDGPRWIDVHLDGEALEISGWTGLEIVPHVTNRLTIRSAR